LRGRTGRGSARRRAGGSSPGTRGGDSLRARVPAWPASPGRARGAGGRSAHLRRRDGVAGRTEWHPTNVHLRFLRLLRAEARKVAGVSS